LLVILILPASGYLLIRNPNVQNYIVHQLSDHFSKKLDAHFEVRSAYYTLFNKLVLHDVFLKDQNGDSLLYAQKVSGHLRFLDLGERALYLKKLLLDSASIHLQNDTTKPINVKFLVEALRRKDTTKPKMHIRCNNFQINHSKLTYHSNRADKNPQGFDMNHMVLNNFNIETRNLNVDSGKVHVDIEQLSFNESCGLEILDLQSKFRLNKRQLAIKNTKLRTPYSFIQTDSIILHHNHYNDFKNPVNKLKLNIAMGESNLGFHDLGYFLNAFRDIPDQNFTLSGRIYGTLDNLKGEEVFLGTGKQSELYTDFSLTGLPDISKTFMYVDVNHLYTGIEDLDLINKLLSNKNRIMLPDQFRYMGRIEYQGNFTGFIDDFVAYGTFNTKLGKFSTDLLLKPKETQGLALEGNLKTRDFSIGGILENEKHFGNLSMNIQVNGTIFPDKGFQAHTNGNIEKLEFNGYQYKNISLNGFLTDKQYDGALSIEDPNVKFSFYGAIDFSKEVPIFDFNAHLEKAKLSKLNLAKGDTTARLSFNLISNFKGDNLDNANGVIMLNQGELIKNNKKLNFENLHINAEHIGDTHRVKLRSDHINAQLVGQYHSTTVHQSLENLALSYLPVFIGEKHDTVAIKAQNDFELTINLNNTAKVTDIFFPSLALYDSSKVKLKYNGKKRSFHLQAESKQFSFKNYHINDLRLNSSSLDSIFSMVFRFKNLHMNHEKEKTYFRHFELKSLTGNNKSKFLINWDDPDQNAIKAEIIALLNIRRSKITNNILTKLYLLPSDIKINNKQWQFSQSVITLDTTSITFNKFRFHHGDQQLAIDGKITKDPADTLNLDFSNIQLNFANMFFPKGQVHFDGIMNGNAKFADLYGNVTFFSDLMIDTLKFNNQKIGNTSIYSQWNEEKERIGIKLTSKRGKLKTLNISGLYSPPNKKMEFDIQLDKLHMAVLNPLLKKSLSGINGALSGNVKVTGTSINPVFNGKLFSHKTAFQIDYLKTRYNFTTPLDVSNNKIIFDQVTVMDQKGNQAQVNGHVYFHSLNNIDYQFNIDAKKLKSLNTSGFDNNTYYGKAFTSGVVSVQGNSLTKDLTIDASLKTEDHSRINLPIGQRAEGEKTQFITFVKKNQDKEGDSDGDELRTNLKGIDLNFNLEVTPLAQSRLIFDPDLHDIIEAQGRGNLNMEVNNNEDFRIYGNYTIEEGDYLFSLKNVINKKFAIEAGSQIIWNGKPQDADIDVTAVYSLRTSLNNLFMDTTEFYNKRIPVDCKIRLTNKLVNPDIDFDIVLPTADESMAARVKGAINTEDEMNKQFLSLIVLNTFMPSHQYLAGQSEPFEMGATSMAFTTSELLSNQLSHWLSKISTNWDIGVNYQPGDEISKNQVEVALSTQILNDRLIINGNVGTSGNYRQSSEFVGDFRVDWKLTPNGKLRLKFFNRNSDRLIYEETRYIQGAGLFYREEFNSFQELFHNIAKKLSLQDQKEKEKKN